MVHQGGVAGPASPSTKCRNDQLQTPLGPPPATNTHPHSCRRKPSLLPQNLEVFPKFGKSRGHGCAGAALLPWPHHCCTPLPGPARRLHNRPFVPLPQKVHFKPPCPQLELRVLSSRKKPPQSLPHPGSGSVTQSGCAPFHGCSAEQLSTCLYPTGFNVI